VPPQDRARRHQEDRPACAGNRPAQHRQGRTIGGPELGAFHLAVQHVELVAQDGDLDVLGVLALEAPKQHGNEPTGHEVEEGQGHRRIIA